MKRKLVPASARDQFIGELAETQDAQAWRNNPSNMQVKVGRPPLIENRGGEVHTFTQVANFGVDLLAN